LEIKVNNTFFTGKFLLHLPSVDSTNNYAKSLIAKSSPIDGTVILADEQFAGRGQSGNVWQSEVGKNLTFSIIYQTSFLPATEQFYLNMAVSLGIWSMVNSQLSIEKDKELTTHDSRLTTKIKWPNDIYVKDQKIAGILIENTISGMHLKHSVIGIGLNVNQEQFPDGLNATSLKEELLVLSDLSVVLNDLLVAVERYFLLLKERKFERLKTEYIESLYRYNEVSAFTKNGISYAGKIIGVDALGNLQIETENGILSFGFKEISFVI
jgi:BirA family biotin operon repressor/biotin-[acetyl-CoA-carboxylase] ligase